LELYSYNNVAPLHHNARAKTKKIGPKRKIKADRFALQVVEICGGEEKSWKDCLSEINTFLITNILGKLEGKMSKYF